MYGMNLQENACVTRVKTLAPNNPTDTCTNPNDTCLACTFLSNYIVALFVQILKRLLPLEYSVMF